MKFELIAEVKGVFYREREEIYQKNKCKIYAMKKSKDSDVNCLVVISNNDYPLAFERGEEEIFNKLFMRAYNFAVNKVNMYEA